MPDIIGYFYKDTDMGDVLSMHRLDHYYPKKYSTREHDYVKGVPLVSLSDYVVIEQKYLALQTELTWANSDIQNRDDEIAILRNQLRKYE